MGKFCTNCGKPLEEGEVCSCQQTASTTEQTVQATSSTTEAGMDFPASNLLNEVFEATKESFKNPIAGVQAFAKAGNFTHALFLIILQAVTTTLFTMISLASIAGKYDMDLKMVYYVEAFFFTLIGSALLSFGLAGIIYILVAIFKGKTTYNHCLAIVATRSMVYVPVSIVCIIFFLLNPFLGIALFLFGNILGLIFSYNAMTTGTQISDTKRVYVIVIASLVFMFVYYLLLRICVGIIGANFMSDLSSLYSIGSFYR